MDFSCLKISESVQVWGLAFMQWNTQEITTLKFVSLRFEDFRDERTKLSKMSTRVALRAQSQLLSAAVRGK